VKKQISRTRAFILCLCMSLSFYDSFSQCGAAPTTGTTAIATNNTIVNSYYPGTGNAVKGTSTLTVGTRDTRGSATALANGNLVLIIQMQGADINTSNNDEYGDGVAGGNASGYLTSNLVAGTYEYNVVSSLSAGTVTFSNPLSHNYYTQAYTAATGIRSFQVIRIQREYNLTINNNRSITAPPWNGSTGGVVVLEVANTLTFSNGNSAVRVDGLGFRGGGGNSMDGATAGNTNGSGAITNTDYRWNSPITTTANKTGGAKGEGIAGTPAYYLLNGATNATTGIVEGYIGGSLGRGAPGNAGGGGTDGKPSTNEFNPGGGGGGNGGAGGQGGSGWDGGGAGGADLNHYPTGGNGGALYAQASSNKFVMGGGGGAGTGNNATPGTNDYLSSGGCGGGIILIRAKTFSGSGVLSANGAAANDVDDAAVTDAAGGGGAGGSIIVLTNTTTAAGANTIKANADGGKGGDMSSYWAHGPGGGGGGGYVLNNAIGGAITVTGGASGRTHKATKTDALDQAYGSVAGANGLKITITDNLGMVNIANPASPCGTLPITLSLWNGVYKNNKTYLTWQAENAVQFSHFVIEHSVDGVHFSSLGQVIAASSGALAQQYSFEDISPASGLNYYRLKMVDQDGQYTYSGIITIRTDATGIQISATPNPFADHMVVTIQSKTDETANLRVINSDGKLVWRKTMYVNAGTNVQYLNDLQSLPKGMYVIKIIKGNTTAEFKMVKQ